MKQVNVDPRGWTTKNVQIDITGTRTTQPEGLVPDENWPSEEARSSTFTSQQGQVVSFGYQKHLDSPCGNFSLTLLPHGFNNDSRSPVYNQISPLQQLVTVKLGDCPVPLITGFVDEVRESGKLGPNMGMRRLHLVGRDVGGLLLNDDISYMPAGYYKADGADFSPVGPTSTAEFGVPSDAGGTVGNRSTAVAALMKVGGLVEGRTRPSQVIKFLIDYFLSMKISLADGGTFKDYFDYDQFVNDPPGSNDYVQMIQLAGYQGSLWNFLMKCIDPIEYELWVETGLKLSGSSGFLRMRRRPFSREDWGMVRNWVDGKEAHRVEDKDVVSWDLGRTHMQSYTCFNVTPAFPSTGGSTENVTFRPIVDEGLVSRFGFRPLAARLNLVPKDLRYWDGDGAKRDIYAKNQMIYRWHVNNHRREFGTLVVKGSANYRVGDKLTWVERKKTYYIEGVKQSWMFGGSFTTTLTLTRGEPSQ